MALWFVCFPAEIVCSKDTHIHLFRPQCTSISRSGAGTDRRRRLLPFLVAISGYTRRSQQSHGLGLCNANQTIECKGCARFSREYWHFVKEKTILFFFRLMTLVTCFISVLVFLAVHKPLRLHPFDPVSKPVDTTRLTETKELVSLASPTAIRSWE